MKSACISFECESIVLETKYFSNHEAHVLFEMGFKNGPTSIPRCSINVGPEHLRPSGPVFNQPHRGTANVNA